MFHATMFLLGLKIRRSSNSILLSKLTFQQQEQKEENEGEKEEEKGEKDEEEQATPLFRVVSWH